MKIISLKTVLYHVLCIFCTVCWVAASANDDILRSSKRIEIIGEATVKIPANQVVISAAVETLHDKADFAASKNALKSEAVVNKLKQIVAGQGRVYTQNYTLAPVYEYDKDKRKSIITGYKASNFIQVEAKNIKLAGNIIDEMVKLGTNGISNLDFLNSSPEEYKQQALKLAVENGMQKAKIVMQASGYDFEPKNNLILAEPLETAAPSPRNTMFKAMAEAYPQGAQTPIEAGELTVSARVRLVYKI